MKKKFLGLTAALAVTALASWAGSAEAIVYCSPGYCANKPLTAECPCAPDTDRAGSPATCGTYNGIGFGGCWYE